jgi:serine/threonine protein kinase
MLKSVSHANIIKYFYSFAHENKLYIVMEFADGGDLYQLMNKRKSSDQPFTETELWNLAYEIASALRYLHSKGIIHRDIK